VSGYVARSRGNEGLFWGVVFRDLVLGCCREGNGGERISVHTLRRRTTLFGSPRTPYGCKKWRIPAHVFKIHAFYNYFVKIRRIIALKCTLTDAFGGQITGGIDHYYRLGNRTPLWGEVFGIDGEVSGARSRKISAYFSVSCQRRLAPGIDSILEEDIFQPGRIRQLFLELRGKCVSENVRGYGHRLGHVPESIFRDDPVLLPA